MKQKILLMILFSAFVFPTFAQKQHKSSDRENRRKEMLEFKIDYLSKEMELKDDQKKQFREVYSQMENERRAILKKIKNAEKAVSGKDVSETEYDKASKEISAARNEMMQVEQKFDEKFSTFLSKKQIFKLKEAENKFMQKMQECKDKRKQEKKKSS